MRASQIQFAARLRWKVLRHFGRDSPAVVADAQQAPIRIRGTSDTDEPN